MATEIKLPELGENLDAGDVLDVKVAAGATVSAGQPLIEVEAEKTTVEVPSPVAGRVAEILVKKGDRVQVGQTFCRIEAGANGGVKPEAAPVAVKPDEARVGQRGSPAEEPTRKEVAVSAEAAAQEKPAPKPAPRPSQPARSSDGDGRPAEEKEVPAGPATRRLARELGVDLHRVVGTARGGRVTEEDVKEFVRQLAGGAAVQGTGAAAAPPLPDFERWGPVERKPLDAVRRRTAEQMSLSWRLVPHVTQHDLADITDLDAFRRQQEGGGPKLTVTAFAVKAAAVALKQFPQFNASLDMAGNQLIFKQYYHVGVAVDTDRGLLVPVLRDVDKKSIADIARELGEIAAAARDKKLKADDMRGGTFTISNLGGIGGTAFSPIVNYPEVAILGMARSRLMPVVHDDAIVPRLMLPLCLSYDHRVIDGADAARFTRRLAELLEQPLRMLLYA